MSIPALTLRQEFRTAALKGTAIELATRGKTGATQIAAADFLNITYPNYDLIKALQAIGPHQDRPVVLIGERGIGKSHLMAARCFFVSRITAIAPLGLRFHQAFDGAGPLDHPKEMQKCSFSLREQVFRSICFFYFSESAQTQGGVFVSRIAGEFQTDPVAGDPREDQGNVDCPCFSSSQTGWG